ncbi:unnamed protein product [Ixodes persulcatus]
MPLCNKPFFFFFFFRVQIRCVQNIENIAKTANMHFLCPIDASQHFCFLLLCSLHFIITTAGQVIDILDYTIPIFTSRKKQVLRIVYTRHEVVLTRFGYRRKKQWFWRSESVRLYKRTCI